VYEGLVKDVNIRVIELQDHVLSMYDRQISNYTQKEFQRCVASSASCRVQISIVFGFQSTKSLLRCYVRHMSGMRTGDVLLGREGINLVFNSRVAAVDKEQVTVVNKCVLCMMPCMRAPSFVTIICVLMGLTSTYFEFDMLPACCSRTKEEYTIPFGACVWSTGVAMHPLLKQVLMEFCTRIMHDLQQEVFESSMD
jgi:hypothetical protein